MNTKNIKIESSWESILRKEFSESYFINLCQSLNDEKQEGKTIYPSEDKIFHAFDRTPFSKLKAVIIGQDPYHNPDQAMGLCFSVPKRLRRPPSLLNIYKELNREYDYNIPSHGDISTWADQGVLLLNAMLTVRANEPGSHRQLGWQKFTDAIISHISNEKEHVAFLLWGNFAKGKKQLIDESKHLILESAHPSPLAGNAFQGNGHFRKTNDYLEANGLEIIDWEIREETDQLTLNF